MTQIEEQSESVTSELSVVFRRISTIGARCPPQSLTREKLHRHIPVGPPLPCRPSAEPTPPNSWTTDPAAEYSGVMDRFGHSYRRRLQTRMTLVSISRPSWFWRSVYMAQWLESSDASHQCQRRARGSIRRCSQASSWGQLAGYRRSGGHHGGCVTRRRRHAILTRRGFESSFRTAALDWMDYVHFAQARYCESIKQ